MWRRGSAVWSVAASAAGHASAVRPVPVPVPAAGRPVDTSHPNQVVGRGTPASCTSAARRGRGSRRRDHPVLVRAKAGHDQDERHGQGREHQPRGGTRRRGTRHAERRRAGAGSSTWTPAIRAQKWTTSHCQDQATPRLVVQNIAFTRRELDRRGLRRRRRRGDLRPRRAPAHRRLGVHVKPLRALGPRHRRRGRPGAIAVPTTFRCTSWAAASAVTRAATAPR